MLRGLWKKGGAINYNFDAGSVEPRTISVPLRDSSNLVQLPSFIVFLFAQRGFDISDQWRYEQGIVN